MTVCDAQFIAVEEQTLKRFESKPLNTTKKNILSVYN